MIMQRCMIHGVVAVDVDLVQAVGGDLQVTGVEGFAVLIVDLARQLL